MKIEGILRTKGYDVVTILESSTVLDAAQLLVEENIGSLVVMGGEGPVGIITERDVLRLAADASVDLGAIGVASAMTREMITASPDAPLTSVMDTMTERRIRHLPVLDGDRLAGIVSIGDLVNACRVSAEQENSALREYIQGAGAA